jgi:hypothetical protein
LEDEKSLEKKLEPRTGREGYFQEKEEDGAAPTRSDLNS